jgi:hypothetical protein
MKNREPDLGRGKRRRADLVVVNDRMQSGYSYLLTEPIGRNFDPEFHPELTPKEMLALGVFCGKYMTDCKKEFPASWLAHAKLSPGRRDSSLNYLNVDAVSPFPCGAGKAGYTRMIRAAGSSGIVAITWAAACRTRTRGRSNAGRPSAVTWRNCEDTASLEISPAARGSARLCYIGPI